VEAPGDGALLGSPSHPAHEPPKTSGKKTAAKADPDEEAKEVTGYYPRGGAAAPFNLKFTFLLISAMLVSEEVSFQLIGRFLLAGCEHRGPSR